MAIENCSHHDKQLQSVSWRVSQLITDCWLNIWLYLLAAIIVQFVTRCLMNPCLCFGAKIQYNQIKVWVQDVNLSQNPVKVQVKLCTCTAVYKGVEVGTIRPSKHPLQGCRDGRALVPVCQGAALRPVGMSLQCPL